MDSLRAYLNLTGPEISEIIEKLTKNTHSILVDKRGVIFEQGAPMNDIYFLSKGVVRYYVSNMDGDIVTKSLRVGPTFLFSVKAYVENSNYSFSAEALSDIKLQKIPCTVWRKLAQEYQSFSMFYSRFLEGLFVEKERRELDLLIKTSMEKLEYFRVEFSEYIDDIPKAIAASYIGVKPETFSRLLSPK